MKVGPRLLVPDIDPAGIPPVSSELLRRRLRWASGVVRRGKFIIAGTVALFAVPTVVYLQSAEKLYSAQAEILIEAPEIGDNLLERSYGKSRLTEASIQTEADIMASASMADKVIDKLKLADDPEFNLALRQPSAWQSFVQAANPMRLLASGEGETLSSEAKASLTRTRIQGRVLSRTEIKSRRRSFVISVRFTANSGEKAARIANTLADLYVVDRLEASFQEQRRINEWLEQRLEGLRQDVAASERAAEQFRVKHNLAQRRKGERQSTITDQQLTELNSRLVLARADLAQRQARYNQVSGLSRNRGSVETAYDVLQSSLIQRLREQESVKQRELSEAMKTYGESHPRIIGQRADLEELRSKIGQEVSKIVSSLAIEVDTARVGVATLEREIGDLKGTVDSAGSREVELRELERQAETSRALYESFLSRYKRDTEQERIQRANARVLSTAAIPVQPASPRRLRILGLSLLLSLASGLGVVFLLDRLNGRIRSVEEAEQITGQRVLAAIPLWKPGKRDKGVSPHFIMREHPRSVLANAFRALHAVLAATAQGGNAKITMVTSAVPQEGKSFVARNLAMAMAATGHRVLLIDADLMRPTQHLPLGIAPKQGLTQLLGQHALPPEPLIVADERGGFELLPAGPEDAHTGNSLAGTRIQDVIAALAPRYDRIIVDAPPSLAATDAQVLSRIADQVLFVVKWNATPRDAVHTALSYLSRVDAPLAGVVLSQTRETADPATAYGGYGYYASYYGKSSGK